MDLIGRNGVRKTTLFKILLDEVDYEGEKIACVLFEYFPFQTTNEDDISIGVYENKYPFGELWKFQEECHLIDLPEELLYRPFKTLSKGEQTKVLLVISFYQKAHLYIWDEPLNDLDIFTRIQLEELLEGEEWMLLFVEHDQHFIEKIATKKIVLEK